MIKFNIGTARDGKDQAISPITVWQTMERLGFVDLRIVGIKASDTETTLIIESTGISHPGDPSISWRVFNLAKQLGQDCIAYRYNGTGYLVGPNVADWGYMFNPEYFLE